jgi:tRNA A22 N-methylase
LKKIDIEVKISLNPRLNSIVEMMDNVDVIADIGTDHGYLACKLIEDNKAKRVIASDLNINPLRSARKTIEEMDMTDVIELRVSNGLEELGDGEADAAVVAGMGGDLIIEIVSSFPNKVAGMDYFVIQPQRAISKVRRWLVENGFFIIDERVALDSGKFYEIIKCSSKKTVSPTVAQWNMKAGTDDVLLELGLPFDLRSSGNHMDEYVSYLEFRIRGYEKRIEGLLKSERDAFKRDSDLFFYRSMIASIKEVLSEFNNKENK